MESGEKRVLESETNSDKKPKIETSKTLLILKPHIVHDPKLVQESLEIIVSRGFQIDFMSNAVYLPDWFLASFYSEHKGKEFWERFSNYMASGRVQFFILSHPSSDAIPKLRKLIGATVDPDPNTLRGKFAITPSKNGFHASDSLESFQREKEMALEFIAGNGIDFEKLRHVELIES